MARTKRDKVKKKLFECITPILTEKNIKIGSFVPHDAIVHL